MSPNSLKSILDSVRAMPDLRPNQPLQGQTHCNEAIRRVFSLSGQPNVFSRDEMANTIADQLEKDTRFRLVGTNEAWREGQQGNLVVVAHKYGVHGHVAMVYPTDSMGHSGSWNKDVPFVSNVGQSIGVVEVSKAFPVALGEPYYYVFVG